ncbi:MAG TPA: protein translocase subunit SecF [Micromonosporaceae bacterium]
MAAPTAKRGGLFRRLYRGEVNFDFIGSRKKWYAASAVIILVCLLSIIFRGFNLGIDFKGGDQFQLPVKAGTTLSQMRSAVESTGTEVAQAQIAGTGSDQTYILQTERVPAKQQAIIAALEKAGHADVAFTSVSSSWGGEVSKQAVTALIVFLIAVSAFIAARFRDWRMAAAAFAALIHDLILTAGVYSIVGFTVTPATVVGLLTILGFSLYDTVVVFDKVDENSRGLLATSRWTYGEAANNAVNQTLMRSINTSLIGLLPVAGLLFVGAGILGVGTLEDLALVLFAGMLTGAYSSLFLATPWLVDLKMMDPRYKNHAARTLSRRAAKAAENEALRSARRSSTVRPAPAVDDIQDEVSDYVAQDDDDLSDEYVGTVPPRVGAKPVRTPAKRTNGPRPPSPNRPGGAKRR